MTRAEDQSTKLKRLERTATFRCGQWIREVGESAGASETSDLAGDRRRDTVRRGGLMKEAHMSGNTKKVKGRAKQAAGAITGDKKLQREGEMDERAGDLENKVDDAADAVKEKVGEVIDKGSRKK
jgi:uncharacterized protein YjbJ (UPF0337 family)